MKITLNQAENEKLIEYFKQNDRNFEASNQYNSFLTECYDYFTADDVRKCQADGSDEETALSSLFYSFVQYNDENDDDGLVRYCDFGHFRILDEKEFLSNPYLKIVKFKDSKFRGCSLLHNYYAPFELFPYQGTETLDGYRELSPIGCFRTKVPYVILTDGTDNIWMSITPYEVNTMKRSIEEAAGNVLTFGLGLGYFAFMAAQKKEVKSVTIVERDSSIIALFKEKILPSFPEKDKITIVKDDAFRRFPESGKYDYIFVDIYRAAEDALPFYLKFRKMEEGLHLSHPVSYWIEGSIFALMRRYLLTFLMEQEAELGEAFYKRDTSENGKLMYRLYLYFKDTEINHIEEIESLLTDESIRKLAGKL